MKFEFVYITKLMFLFPGPKVDVKLGMYVENIFSVDETKMVSNGLLSTVTVIRLILMMEK